MDLQNKLTCPSCGGSGGGPMGRAGSTWDTEDYVCPRCKGLGVVALAHVAGPPSSARPGVAKAPPAPALRGQAKTGEGKA